MIQVIPNSESMDGEPVSNAEENFAVKGEGSKEKYVPLFPRPKDIAETPPAVFLKRDGTEQCNLLTAAGKREYKRRRLVAWEAQEGLCAICHRWVPWDEATTDHIRPRSLGRDDRQENLQMLCWNCNSLKGSTRVGYY